MQNTVQDLREPKQVKLYINMSVTQWRSYGGGGHVRR